MKYRRIMPTSQRGVDSNRSSLESQQNDDDISLQSDIVTVRSSSSSNQALRGSARSSIMAESDFRAQVKAEEERVMAEFGIDRSIQIPMIGDVHDVSDDLSTVAGATFGYGSIGNETGTTSTGDIYSTQSEWMTKFGGGQMDEPEPRILPIVTPRNSASPDSPVERKNTNRWSSLGGGAIDMDDSNQNRNSHPSMAGAFGIVTPPKLEKDTILKANDVNQQLALQSIDTLSPSTENQQCSAIFPHPGGDESTHSALQGSTSVSETSSSVRAESLSVANDVTISGVSVSVAEAGKNDANDGDDEDFEQQQDSEALQAYPIIGIANPSRGGWPLLSGRNNSALGSQSSLAVSESESSFDEADNNNFPSSILGSAGMAPAALMATNNWSSTNPNNLVYTPRRSRQIDNGDPSSPGAMLDSTVSDEEDFINALDFGQPSTTDNHVAHAPTSASQLDDDDDGNNADDEMQGALENKTSLDLVSAEADESGEYKIEEDRANKNPSEKPYNKSVRPQSSKTKYPALPPRNSYPTSDSKGIASTNSDDEDNIAPNAMYSIPHVNNNGSGTSNTDTTGPAEIRPGRTISFGSEGLTATNNDERKKLTPKQQSASSGLSSHSSSTPRNAAAIAALAAADAAGIASVEHTSLSSVGSPTTISFPGKQGTGGLYQITSAEDVNKDAANVMNLSNLAVASSGAGAGFNVGNYNINADDKISQLGARDVTDVEHGAMKMQSSTGDLQPLGMIILGTVAQDDGDEDVSLLKGFKSSASLDSSSHEERAPPPPPENGRSVENMANVSSVNDEVISIWNQRVFGIRMDRLVLALIMVVVVSLAVVVGSVVAQQQSESGSGSAPDLNTGERTPAPTLTFSTMSPSTVPSTVPPSIPPTIDTPTPPSSGTRPTIGTSPTPPTVVISPSSTPTISIQPTLEPTIVIATNRPTVLCIDSDTAEFFGGVGIGIVNCTWLSGRPGHAQRLCVPGNEAYEECRVTCDSCGISGSLSDEPIFDVTIAPTLLPSQALGSTFPSYSPISGTDAPSVTRTEDPTFLPTQTITEMPTLRPTGVITTESPTEIELTTSPSSEREQTLTPSSTNPPTEGAISTEVPTAGTVVPSAAFLPTVGTGFQPEDIEDIIRDASIQSRAALNDPSSPQSQALDWLESAFQDGVYDSADFTETRLVTVWALATFAISTQTAEGMAARGWLNEPNECDWDGIACASDGSISEINLSNSDLQGTVPHEITLIQSLQGFIVSDNLLIGQLPDSMGNLVNLETLAIDRNAFSGELPSSIVDLENMHTFHFERNLGIDGSFPIGLARIRSLRSLIFYYTSISGEVPDEICSFIEELILDCRQVESTCWTRCFYRCGGNSGIVC